MWRVAGSAQEYPLEGSAPATMRSEAEQLLEAFPYHENKQDYDGEDGETQEMAVELKPRLAALGVQGGVTSVIAGRASSMTFAKRRRAMVGSIPVTLSDSSAAIFAGGAARVFRAASTIFCR